MKALFALLTFAPPLVAGLATFRLKTPSGARAIALASSVLAALSAAGYLGIAHSEGSTSSDALFATSISPSLPLVAALVGLVAVALNPAATGVGTAGRILLMNASTLVAALLTSPAALTGIWAAQVLLVVLELRSRPDSRPTARVAALYLVPSVLLAGGAALLFGRGNHEAGAWVLLGAVAVRTALVPAHSWFPALMERAPIGLMVSFMSPVIGVHFALATLDKATFAELSPLVSDLAVFTAVVAGALAVVQLSARRALAYIMMSEGALVVYALGTHADPHDLGMVSVWAAVAVTTAGFAMIVAALEARRGTLRLDRPNGSYERVPLLATAFLILGLASVGLPGTFGFVAEDVLVGATFGEHPRLTMALLGATALNAVSVVRAFFYLFMGRRDHSGEVDLLPREWAAVTLLLAVLIVEGLWPSAGLRLLAGPAASPPAPSLVSTLEVQP